MNTKPLTKVIFRKWRDTGSVIAFFPRENWDSSIMHCSSYERVGQHGGAHYLGCLKHTTPATPQEYAPLKSELERIGYVLVVGSRQTSKDRSIRIA